MITMIAGRSRLALWAFTGFIEELIPFRLGPGSCFIVRMRKRERTKPAPLAEALGEYLSKSGLRKRVQQGEVVAEWPRLVGPKIAAVTQPLHVSADSTLFVAVKTSAWMSELSLLEPELLRAVNAGSGDKRVRKIRFRLMR